MGQIKKMKALYYINLGVFNIIGNFIFLFDLFYILSYIGQKSKTNFVRFLVQMRTRKFAYEIYWPLTRPWYLIS